METEFYNKIANSTAHRPIRDVLSNQVLVNQELFPILLKMAFDVQDKNHHKACWTLELVLEAKIIWIKNYIDLFCNTLSKYSHESALRSISKICLFVTTHQAKGAKLGNDFTTPKHREQITESCFDWLIKPNGKVATKAYAMRTLYVLGKNEEWIYPELKRILSEDAGKHTAAYISAANDILKKIKHNQQS